MGRLGILLFTSPVQHRASETVAGIAGAAADAGHEVRIFCLGDGVYNTSRAIAAVSDDNPVRRLAALGPRADLVSCTTCARFRGLAEGDLVPNGRLGTLEDLSELLAGSDRFLTFSTEDAP